MDKPARPVRLLGAELTARRAGLAIALFTLVATLLGGLVIRVTDPDRFETLGVAFWWSAQTVTTVGYGDVVPTDPLGRTTGVLIMLIGTAFVAVVTAAITASFVESARSRLRGEEDDALDRHVAALNERLDRIEAALRERP